MADSNDRTTDKETETDDSSPLTTREEPIVDPEVATGSQDAEGAVGGPSTTPQVPTNEPGRIGGYKRSTIGSNIYFNVDPRSQAGYSLYPDFNRGPPMNINPTPEVDPRLVYHPNVNFHRGSQGYGSSFGYSAPEVNVPGLAQSIDAGFAQGPSTSVAPVNVQGFAPGFIPGVSQNDPSRRSTIHPSRADMRINSDDSEIIPGSSSTVKPIMFLQAMQRWDITFSGALGEDVELFLSRIQEGLDLLGVNEDTLLKTLPFLLKGGALVWYRARVKNFATWQQVRLAFRSRFADPDYQIALREEISRRTQAEGEPIGEYLACMNGLFDRTDPSWTEWERVRYAHRGMHPAYRIAISLTDTLTMNQLESLAIRHEQVWRSLKERRAPPLPEESMCPAYAYAGPRTHNTQFYPYVTSRPSRANVQLVQQEYDYEIETLEAMQSRSSQKKTGNLPTNVLPTPVPFYPTNPVAPALAPVSVPVPQATGIVQKNSVNPNCWNCSKSGHLFRFCPEPRRRFCFKCQAPGVTSVNCPRCNQGNAQQ
ncbi:uncharacterized protein [Chelonus insularis]|uniref:uncharacterized protein n=1 Tax=Chelonus insularis TaxID=460826 RepID=UPI00158B7C7A|nr:uncharacterized protein LOC118065795 [Chelonus insularis]XP_034947930.1 uncharacterized protein LOC118072307 [Chelonus insularis]